MRYIKFCASTDYVGTEETRVVAYEDDVKDGELDCDLTCIIDEVADSYEYLVDNEVFEEDYETTAEYDEAVREAAEEYRENCTGYWEEISQEEYEEMA